VTVEVKRSILGKDGRPYKEDMQVVTGNAACAIAFRNAVFKVIPAALVQDVYEKAKEVARGTAETLPARRDKAIKYFHDRGVKDSQICDALGIKKVEDIDLDKLSTLRGMVTLINNGESTIEDLFPQRVDVEDLQLLLDAKKEALTPADLKNAERIIKNQEQASYSKLLKTLQAV
jgi:hypothetical protein